MLILWILLSTVAAHAETLHFPENFKWCVATSAHQIEGGNTQSDWWQWEFEQGHIQRGERSGQACDHWNRVDEDIRLLQDLHVRQYRMSIEWAKIEPAEGQIDREAVAHYRREIDSLMMAGIEPMITLQHFTLPLWLARKGGWKWEGVIAAFEAYTRLVYLEIGPGVRDWVTVNEPMITLPAGYLGGGHPPGETYPRGIIPPIRNLLFAHAQAYRALHEMAASAHAPVRVGFAHHLRIFEPRRHRRTLDRTAANILNQAFNWAFLDALSTGFLHVRVPFAIKHGEFLPGVAGTQDFLGVNYYGRDLVSFAIRDPKKFRLSVMPGAPVSDLGWELYPEGLYRVLEAAHERFPKLPILITENGLADAKDRHRSQFITSHLAQVHRAIQDGIPVEGYCHWSLMDNFEWTEGFRPRFGLYEVDYSTQRRTPRPSAILYSEIAAANLVQVHEEEQP